MKDERSEHKEAQEDIEGKQLPYLTAVSVYVRMW